MLPGSLAPRQQEHLVHLASCLPFEQAARMLGDLLGVQVNAETTRRLTEQMGAWMDVAQQEDPEASASAEAAGSSEPAVPQRCVMSVDGAMISLIQKQWVEVRTVAIGEPESQQSATGEPEIHVGHLSYFSCLLNASTFTELAQEEMQRRKVAQTAQVCMVTDGAEWCQAFTDRYRPDAVRILDFPHAAEHVSALLEGCSHAGIRLPEQMLSRCLHVLKHRGPAPLRRMADRLAPEFAQHKGVQEHVEYLCKREALMQYPQFRAQGWPIGSGIVESANKLVVQARLKGPGMHWERTNVNPLLALRLAVCNDRWSEMWRKALACRRSHVALPRSAPTAPSSPSAPMESASSSPSLQTVAGRRTHPTGPKASHPHASPRAASPSRGTTGVPTDGGWCGMCGTPLGHVRGHRPKQYCSVRCRVRAYRARGTADLMHQTLTSLDAHRVPRRPFVKERADLCPCGTPVVQNHQARGHRPRLYCSVRCRVRAHRWRHAGHHEPPNDTLSHCLSGQTRTGQPDKKREE